MFKSHLDMIGRNESPTKKAKFWQSYVRSLKGSEDIRAHDAPRVSTRPFSAYDSYPSHLRSIYDEASAPGERIQSTGYRYLPVHRETYGYSPRAIYDHHYSRTIPANYDVERAWNEHLKRMQDIERRYPSRYGLYLKDKPTPLVPLEYEPEDKPLLSENCPKYIPIYTAPRSLSLPPPPRGARSKTPAFEPLQPLQPYRGSSPSARGASPYRGLSPIRESSVPRASSVPRGLSPFRASSLPRALSPIRESSYDPWNHIYSKLGDNPILRHCEREGSPTPVKPGRWGPRDTEIAYDAEGLPIFHPRNRYSDIFNPSPNLPISRITRDPFWWDMEDLAPFRPFIRGTSLPSLIRDSYLSPVKRGFLWRTHPIRPFAHL